MLDTSSKSPHPLKYFGFILVPFLTFLLGWNIAEKFNFQKIEYIEDKNGKQEIIFKRRDDTDSIFSISLLEETLSVLKNKYVERDILDDKEKLMYGSVRGMVNALDDPFTVFMDPKENKEFQDSLYGQLEGIGAELTIKNDLLVVVSPLKGSPASKAGVRPEDVILKINGEDARQFSLEQAVLRIRGEKGTPVALTLFHPDELTEREVTIIRDVITIESVSYEEKNLIFDDGREELAAYVSINQFGENTTKEFDKIIDKMLLKKPKGMVLDLRFNGGGYLEGAVDIVSRFISHKPVVTIKKKDGYDDIHETNSSVRVPDLPLAVLINRGSASASEIVAGAIQDHQRGIVIGEKSFGKGTVQEVISLSDGSSLRVTIAKWFTPNGKNITETGISPDIEVPMSLEDYKEKRDPQLDRALEYLKGF